MTIDLSILAVIGTAIAVGQFGLGVLVFLTGRATRTEAARAAAEAKRAQAEVTQTSGSTGEKLEIIHGLVNSRWSEAQKEIARLRAMVERLTGDALPPPHPLLDSPPPA